MAVTLVTRRQAGEGNCTVVKWVVLETIPMDDLLDTGNLVISNACRVQWTGHAAFEEALINVESWVNAMTMDPVNTGHISHNATMEAESETSMAIIQHRSAKLRGQEEGDSSCEPNVKEVANEDVLTVAVTPESHEILQTFGGVVYAVHSKFEGISPDDVPKIAIIPCYSITTVLEDAENFFEQFELCAWDSFYYWGVETEAFVSRVCRSIIAVDDDYLPYYRTSESKLSRYVTKVMESISTFAKEPLVPENIDVDVWGYRYYWQLPYVENLCDLSADTGGSWFGR